MQDFTNGTLDLDLLPKYEEVPLHSLSPGYWKVVLLNILTFLLILAGGLATAIVLTGPPAAIIYLVAGAYLALGILLVVLYRASLKNRGYALREKDLIYKSGIIVITTSIIPFNRIQHITLNEGIYSRMFHLGALHVFTAGGGSGSIIIAGIEIDEAKKIKEELTRQLAQID